MAEPAFELDLTDKDGNDFQADEQYTMQHLASMGEQPVGVSSDGSAIIMKGSEGTYQVPIADYWQDQGYNVKATRPADPDYDHVDTALRAKMESLPDDGMKRFYLEREMQNRGVKDAKIVGNGSDWYIAEPTTGKWIALTNKPGLDWSDAGQALNVGTSLLGGVAGAGMGAIAGGIPGGALGGAAGTTLARGTLDSIYRHADPAYADTQNQYKGELAKDYGKEALISGAAGLLPGVAPLARTMGFLGKGAQGVGKLAEGAGGLAANRAVAEVGSALAPGFSTVSNYGTLASLGKRGVEGLTALARKAAASPNTEKYLGQDFAQGLKSRVGNIAGDTSEEILASMGAPNLGKVTEQAGRAGIGAEQKAADVFQGLGRNLQSGGQSLQRGSDSLGSFSKGFGNIEPDILRQSLSKYLLDKSRGPGVLKKQPVQSTMVTSNSSY